MAQSRAQRRASLANLRQARATRAGRGAVVGRGGRAARRGGAGRQRNAQGRFTSG